MADKIKAFFQKKKANNKFMNAGKGYKYVYNVKKKDGLFFIKLAYINIY